MTVLGPFGVRMSLAATVAWVGLMGGRSTCDAASLGGATVEEIRDAQAWANAAFAKPATVTRPAEPQAERITVLHSSHKVLKNRTVWDTPLMLGDKRYARGLYMDAPASVRIRLSRPAVEFTAVVGIDNNHDTKAHPQAGSARFHVVLGGRRAFTTPVRKLADGGLAVKVPLPKASEFVLEVDAGDNGRGWDQCDWADAAVKFEDGSTRFLDELAVGSWRPNASSVPISFVLGGVYSDQLLPAWQYSSQTQPIPGGTCRTISYSDPKTALAIDCRLTCYDHSAAMDWVCQLRNTGLRDTPVLEQFMPLDTSRLLSAGGDAEPVVLRWSNGDSCSAESFLPHDENLLPGTGRQFAALSSDTTCLPFFNVKDRSGGWIVAVGWTGRWAAEFARPPDGAVAARAGMQQTRLVLRPGEQFRTPRILLLRYHGTQISRGHNQCRRLMRAHYVPRLDGKPIQPPVAYTAVAGLWLKSTRSKQPLGRLTEATELAAIPKAAAMGCEAY